MIRINCTVQGRVTELPTLTVDGHAPVTGDIPGLDGLGRCTFVLRDETPPWGAWLRWQDQAVRVEIAQEHDVPLAPGDYEGALLVVPFPVLVYRPQLGRLRVEGDHFIGPDGQRWWWKGATDMLLPARLEAGEDIRPILDQRREAGATIVRALAMGYPFWPSGAPARWETVRQFFDLAAEAGLCVEWTVFAGTRFVMPSPPEQEAFWRESIALAAQYPHVLLELLNEVGHWSQQIDPQRFEQPSMSLASHGSGLTNAPPVEPLWHFATFHPRRDHPPDARGFVRYDSYAFQAVWPKPCPYIPDEGIKPYEYGFDTGWAAQMGRHAAVGGAGGSFHSDAGVRSLPWSVDEVRCARAFYEAIR